MLFFYIHSKFFSRALLEHHGNAEFRNDIYLLNFIVEFSWVFTLLIFFTSGFFFSFSFFYHFSLKLNPVGPYIFAICPNYFCIVVVTQNNSTESTTVSYNKVVN